MESVQTVRFDCFHWSGTSQIKLENIRFCSYQTEFCCHWSKRTTEVLRNSEIHVNFPTVYLKSYAVKYTHVQWNIWTAMKCTQLESRVDSWHHWESFHLLLSWISIIQSLRYPPAVPSFLLQLIFPYTSPFFTDCEHFNTPCVYVCWIFTLVADWILAESQMPTIFVKTSHSLCCYSWILVVHARLILLKQ